MEKLKLKLEIIKFKITLFMTIIGASVYLLINKKSFLFIDNLSFYLISGIVFIYGISGFVTNIIELNKLKKEINEQY